MFKTSNLLFEEDLIKIAYSISGGNGENFRKVLTISYYSLILIQRSAIFSVIYKDIHVNMIKRLKMFYDDTSTYKKISEVIGTPIFAGQLVNNYDSAYKF